MPKEIYLLAPSVLALVLSFFVRDAFFALSMGALLGGVMVCFSELTQLPQYLYEIFLQQTFQSPWRSGALILSLELAAFSVLIEQSGLFQSLFHHLQKNKNKKQSPVMSLVYAGLFCFYDGLANAILLGRLSKMIQKRTAVSNEKLAYIVDSTSSAVACLVVFSTWTAYQLSLVQDALLGTSFEGQGLSILMRSVPFNFYCILTLLVLIVAIKKNINLGPMKKAEENAVRAYRMSDEQNLEVSPAHSLFAVVLPFLILFGSFFLMVFCLALQSDTEGGSFFVLFLDAMSSDSIPALLNISGLLAVLFVLPGSVKKVGFNQSLKTMIKGVYDMCKPLLILFGAWALSQTIKDLGVTTALLEGFKTVAISLATLPAISFSVACLISFLTGTSWGTLGILMPLMVPLMAHQSDSVIMLCATIGAVFGGAVFGDHCSPISDTTVVSAFSTGCELRAHVKTQMPYAVLAAIISLLMGYMPMIFYFS